MEEKFDFENLVVWQKSIEFVDLILEKTEAFYNSKGNFRLREQLDGCSTSIVLNIAEGKGRYSKKEFKQFLYYSRGLINETVSILLLLHKRSWLSIGDYILLKRKAIELSKLLNGLINSLK